MIIMLFLSLFRKLMWLLTAYYYGSYYYLIISHCGVVLRIMTFKRITWRPSCLFAIQKYKVGTFEFILKFRYPEKATKIWKKNYFLHEILNKVGDFFKFFGLLSISELYYKVYYRKCQKKSLIVLLFWNRLDCNTLMVTSWSKSTYIKFLLRT